MQERTYGVQVVSTSKEGVLGKGKPGKLLCRRDLHPITSTQG
jgi:hypothetical protein